MGVRHERLVRHRIQRRRLTGETHPSWIGLGAIIKRWRLSITARRHNNEGARSEWAQGKFV